MTPRKSKGLSNSLKESQGYPGVPSPHFEGQFCSVISQKTFSVKGDIVNILGFIGHTISVATTELYHWGMKAAIDNT